MLLDHYLTDNYIDKTLELYQAVVSDKYYVNMAMAWGLSVCYVKYSEKTERFLSQGTVDEFTLRKCRQKIRQSRRVPKIQSK